MPSTLPGNSDGPAGPRAANWPPPARSHCWTLSRERPRLHFESPKPASAGHRDRDLRADRGGRRREFFASAGTGGFWCPSGSMGEGPSALSSIPGPRCRRCPVSSPASCDCPPPASAVRPRRSAGLDGCDVSGAGGGQAGQRRWLQPGALDDHRTARCLDRGRGGCSRRGFPLSPASRPAVRRGLVHAWRGGRVRCGDAR